MSNDNEEFERVVDQELAQQAQPFSQAIGLVK